MKLNQVAVQLFTCRDLLKTPTDIASTLRKLRKIGYTAVQVSGMGAIAEEELIAILNGEGMVCCATHESGAEILKNPHKIVERLQKLGCTITAYPWPADIDFSSTESVLSLISGLEKSGEVLAKAGQTLCYHNHNVEFRKLQGKTVLELIYAGTNHRHLQGELDTYWVQHGGGDIVWWCEQLANRLPILHIKDYMTTDQNQPMHCEIGAGNLNFKRIIAAAEKSGCQWFAVEQDTCPGDPLESLEKSFRYISEYLVE